MVFVTGARTLSLGFSVTEGALMLKNILVLTVVLASSVSFGKSLAGTYEARNCFVYDKDQNQVALEGEIEISENVPVGGPFQSTYPAIIFQMSGVTDPVLTLGIGKVVPFQYGPEPFSVGAYGATPERFKEEFYSPDTLTGTVELMRHGNYLVIKSSSQTNSLFCSLDRLP